MVTISWLLAAWVWWGSANPNQMQSHHCLHCYHGCWIPPPSHHHQCQPVPAYTAVSDGTYHWHRLWNTICMSHKWGPGDNGSFAGGISTVPSFCSSFPHHGQKDRPLHHLRALGEWIPLKPIILGNSVGITTQKTWMSFGNFLPCAEWPRGPLSQSIPAGPHGYQSPWGQQRWPSPWRYGTGHGTSHGHSWGSAFWNTPA